MALFKVWECQICNWVFDEALGCPDDGIPPGTRWEDVPDDWCCPECGVGKDDFDMREVKAQETASPAVVESITYQPDDAVAEHPIVIVGTGLAGYGLVKALRAESSTIPIVMISSDDGAYYSKPVLSTSFADNRCSRDIIIATARQQAEKFGLTLFSHTNVVSIDSETKQIELDNGGRMHYRQLILATGAQCIVPPISGINGPRVCQVNNLSDYQRVKNLLPPAGRILIVGAGLIGAEFADNLTMQGHCVNLVDPSAGVMFNALGETGSSLLTQSLQKAGVKCHMGAGVSQIESDHRYARVTLTNGQSLQVDLVISAVGIKPNIALAEQAGIRCERGIVVSDTLSTSHADIFALGDCIQFQEEVRPYVAAIQSQVKVLSKTLLGQSERLSYGIQPVVVKTPSHPVTFYRPLNCEGHWQVDQIGDEGLKAKFIDRDGNQTGFMLSGAYIDDIQGYRDRCLS